MMSDAVRVYGGMKRGARKVRGRSHGGKVLIAVLVVVCVWAYWTTRDTYPIQALIPANKAYHVVTKDVFAKRVRLAESEIWKALPPQLGAEKVPTKLSQEFPMPQWILNHLVPDACYVMGNDMKTFGDLLVVTRMTRVGSLLEKVGGFFASSEDGHAAGLELHKMGGLYYGIRGRVLLLSGSRRDLIEALTLLPDETIKVEALDQITDSLGEADIYGRFQLAEDDPTGDVVESGSFSVRIDKAAATIEVSTHLRPAWRDKTAGLLEGVKPFPLQAPPDGVLQLSVNVGKDVEGLWKCAGAAFGKEAEMEQLWAKWSAAPAEDAPKTWSSILPGTAVGLLGHLGPGVRASLVGVDLNEIVPVPQLVFTLDTDPLKTLESFKALPAPPEESQPWESYVRYDENAQVVRLPLIGGPSLEPTAGVKGSALVLSSSRIVAEALLSDPATADPATLPEPGNIFALIKPHDCGKAAFDFLLTLAEAGLLRDTSPQTLQDKYGPWLENAARVKEVSALAGYDSGTLTLKLGMVCPESAPPVN